MFTGIIEEVGTIAAARAVGNGVALSVRAAAVLEGLALGDSVAIDGVCQTVTARSADSFTVEAVATTLGRTTLGDFRPGRRVNLERALALGQRMGGHLVQGHVDGVGQVRAVSPREELVLIDFTLTDEVEPVTILHGSIALNGVSLTVNALPSPGVAQVSIIPFTWQHTALSELRAGSRVNLEGDLIGKYVRRLLGAAARGQEGGSPRLSENLLRAWGY